MKLQLPHWAQLLIAFLLVSDAWAIAEVNSHELVLPAAAVGVLTLLQTLLGLLSPSVRPPAVPADAVKSAATKIGPLAVITLVALLSSGCMVAIPQPGQTPAQVQACSTDATLHNVAIYSAATLTTGAGVEAAVASQMPSAAQGLGIAGAITAGLAAVAVGGTAILAQTYAADGCAPALPLGAQKP